jgi:hypothetical protein
MLVRCRLVPVETGKAVDPVKGARWEAFKEQRSSRLGEDATAHLVAMVEQARAAAVAPAETRSRLVTLVPNRR